MRTAGAADDGLDLSRLTPWWLGAVGMPTGPLRAARFGGGFSNWTYRVSDDRSTWVLRRPPAGVGPGSAHDMAREHRVLQALHPVLPLAPRPVALCGDLAVLGCPFFVMDYVRGRIVRGASDEAVLAPTQARRAAEAVVDALAAIHAVPLSSAAVAGLGRPEGYVERQVAGWRQRWDRARTEPQPLVEATAEWLGKHQPAMGDATVVHNDFKHDNVVLAPDDVGSVQAVLDWEMATVGCPQLDVGTALGYWVEPDDPPALRALGLGCTQWPGTLRRAEVVRRYEQVSGRQLAQPVWAYVFGLFKVAVIAQQLLARFSRGAASDPRFAGLGVAVGVLGQQAQHAIARGQLSAAD